MNRVSQACDAPPPGEGPGIASNAHLTSRERWYGSVVLVETTGKKRDRSFVYRSYVDRLRVGTELDGAQVLRR